MKGLSKRFTIIALVALMTFFILPVGTAFAEMDDGTYELDYEMKEKSSENTSIADGYFTKPAMLFVEDGEKHVQITVTGADMIKSLETPTGPVEIIDEDEENDERTVKFRVDQDLSEPLVMDMHVVVPDLYDTVHQARAFFDVSSLEDSIDNDQAVTGSEAKDEENPQTGDHSPILVYTTLLFGSIACLTVYKLWMVRNDQ